MILRAVNEGDQNKVDFYTFVPDIDFNIIVVDGILRNECLQHAIKLLSKKGGIIIADNWQQDFVWLSPAAEDLMKPYERKIFVQPDHTNHEGNAWKTAIFTIPKL
jgi:predicted O-methyltransferase YrrM